MDLFAELEFDDDLLDSVEDAKPRIIIEAFCVFNSAVVHIAYPTSQQGWVYRADLGGHSLHRWDLGDSTCIVARHSTCSKAMRPRDTPCRNCIMKKTWRRECKEACNTFFLYALVDVNRTLQALSTFIISTLSPSLQDVALYKQHVPKLSRRSCRDTTKMQRMVHMEQNLRFTIARTTAFLGVQMHFKMRVSNCLTF